MEKLTGKESFEERRRRGHAAVGLVFADEGQARVIRSLMTALEEVSDRIDAVGGFSDTRLALSYEREIEGLRQENSKLRSDLQRALSGEVEFPRPMGVTSVGSEVDPNG